MSVLEVKTFENPDEVRSFKGHGRIEIVRVGGLTVGRGIYEPGWKWSQDVAPIAGTASCQASHAGYVLAGRLGVRMEDGTEAEMGPGDAVVIGPGHDAWTVGDEACVLVDFGESVSQFAKSR